MAEILERIQRVLEKNKMEVIEKSIFWIISKFEARILGKGQ